MRTLPYSFRMSYPSTYAIIEGSEDLLTHHQICSCSPQHGAKTNIIKQLVARTPNGAISFISPVFVDPLQMYS